MKRLRLKRWVITLWLFIPPPAFSASQDVLNAVLSKDRACQDIWLAQFDPHEPGGSLPKHQEAPERMGDDLFLFKVNLAEGIYGHLRYGWTGTQIRDAAFLNEFLQRSPGVSTSSIRIIEMTDELSRLERDEGAGDNWLLELELPGTPGFAYIEEKFGFKLRDELAYYQKRFAGDFTEAQQKDHARVIEALWHGATSEARKTIKEDLGFLIPELTDMADEDLVGTLTRKDFGLSYEQWAVFDSTMIFERLPYLVRRGIADLWAVSFVAGNDSFNGRQWLLYERQSDHASVLGSQIYSLGSTFDNHQAFAKAFSPFAKNYPYLDVDNEAYLQDELELLLRREISPSVKSFLVNLTAEQIKAVAANADYPITDKQIEGLLERAASFRLED